MSADATPYNLPVNHLAQLAGKTLPSGAAAIPPSKPTYAAAVVLGAGAFCVEIDGVASVSAACAVSMGAIAPFGMLMSIIFGDTGGVTFTLGSGFKTAAGTINPTNGKKIVVLFVSDGVGGFYELCRGSAV